MTPKTLTRKSRKNVSLRAFKLEDYKEIDQKIIQNFEDRFQDF